MGRTRTVDAHACRLRRRLAAAGAEGLISNVRGVGYQLADLPAPGGGPDHEAGAAKRTGSPVELRGPRRAA
jgi:DNA-binding winged helix-turn-helix (wHTH) protein